MPKREREGLSKCDGLFVYGSKIRKKNSESPEAISFRGGSERERCTGVFCGVF